MATASAHELASADRFFASMRPLFGTMTKAEVKGIEAKLTAKFAGCAITFQSALVAGGWLN